MHLVTPLSSQVRVLHDLSHYINLAAAAAAVSEITVIWHYYYYYQQCKDYSDTITKTLQGHFT